MKPYFITLGIVSYSLLTLPAPAEIEVIKDDHTQAIIKKHQEGVEDLTLDQDDLSADVQDLIDEQTDPELIEIMREIEVVMADAIDLLDEGRTDGETIATETEIIEKIFEAAKKKKQQSGEGEGSPSSQQSMGSMLQMMESMMNGGKDIGEGQQPGSKPGEGEGQGGGNGSGGQANGTAEDPDNTAPDEERLVPKNSGNTGSSLPKEFQKAMDAYNKGAQALTE